jgi:hypothetical protein
MALENLPPQTTIQENADIQAFTLYIIWELKK